jgi:AcrR family transcriptional regulator
MRNTEKDEKEMTAKREAMLNEGFRLFTEKGIEAVSMQDVADACGIGIATLYRYYKTKLDLVLAIGVRKWEEYGMYVVKARSEKNADALSAAEGLSFYLDMFIALYQNFKDLLIFNQDFNNYMRTIGAGNDILKPYTDSIGSFSRMFDELYERGKKDKTIRTDLPKDKMFSMTVHIMLAVAVRFAQGLVYSAEREEDRTEELELLKHMILNEFVIK